MVSNITSSTNNYRLSWLRWRRNSQQSPVEDQNKNIISYQRGLVGSMFDSTMSALFAFVFIWRILLDKLQDQNMSGEHSAKRAASDLSTEGSKKRRQSELGEDSSTSSSRSPSPTAVSPQRSSKGVSHLLQTDNIPLNRPTEAPPPIPLEGEPVYEVRTVGVDREEGSSGSIPDYLFLSSDIPIHPAYNFLDSITEEDSDDIRSPSQSSSAARPTSVDFADFSRSQAVLRAQNSSSSSGGVGIVELSTPPSSEEQRHTEIVENPKPSDLNRSESQRSVVSSSASEKASVIDNSETVAKAQLISNQSGRSQIAPISEAELADPRFAKMNSSDADRDQTEMLVTPNDQFSSVFTPLEDGRISNTSVSINLDQSRDSLLDHSICSNPHDETSAIHSIHKMSESVPKVPVESDEEEELPDPPATAFSKKIETHTIITTPAAVSVSHQSVHSPAADSAAETLSNDPASETVSPISNNPISTQSQSQTATVTRPSGSERLAGIVYGYEGSPLNWSKTKLKSNAFGDSDKSDADKENTSREAPQLTSSYVNTSYTSSFAPTASHSSQQNDYRQPQHTSFQPSRHYEHPPGFGMSDHPPGSAPPPPPILSSNPIGGRSFTDDDLMSDRNRSRSTIREIPIQRELNPFGVSQSSATTMPSIPHHGNSTTAWTTTRYDPITGNPQEEYYRREVMTRTLVTRSTEALSAPPPLSRSSPVDTTIRQLPEPRDEITEEILYKYSKNIEEEERRIRESQGQRKADEENRRRQIEEKLRAFEEQEKIRLDRLRLEREQVERDFENDLARREQAEKERIEYERKLREQHERKRREEWERLENERRQLEEAELAKRRQLEELEKERLRREKARLEELERLRIEEERRRLEQIEQARMEKERIERERIERERIEIERIERIKREQREKQKQEDLRRKEEEDKLRKERLEAERIEKERLELERRQRELLIIAQREAEERARQRQEDDIREQQRRAQEQRDRELLEHAKREARDRELLRRQKEEEEHRRIQQLKLEQDRLERERLEALRREQGRKEEEARERELFEAAKRNQEKRERERLEEEAREKQRRMEEAMERQKLAELEAAARDRHNQKLIDQQRERERLELERRTRELQDIDEIQKQRRNQERLEEERRLTELEAAERRKAEQRDRERQAAAERENQRRLDDRKSRDNLEELAREKETKEQWAIERLRLLREHEELEKRRQALTSKETLERLTRKPYYSRENLSTIGQPEVTTKVERQVIERVDRTLWSSEGDRYPNTTATTTHYSHSALPPSNFDTHDDLGPQRERLFSNNNTSQDDRASKLKARNEKARRDYFSNDPNVDQLSDRFSKLNEYPEQRRVDYRGPLLQNFNGGELRSDYDSGPPPYSYSRPDTSPYDQEYKRLVQLAEKNLAAYRQRLSQPSLNTGLLETDLDFRPSTRPEDDVYRSKSVLDYTVTRQSRRELTDADFEPHSHSRSKSADYLMNKQLREDAAPPENELKKTADGLSYAPPVEPAILTEHEQRFRKSMERLQSTAPDWYRDRAPPPATNISQNTDFRSSGYGSRPWSRQNYEQQPSAVERQRYPSGSALNRPGDLGSPVGGISFPVGMFDRYKDEIEDLRRSRSSLHQAENLGSPVNESRYSKEYSKEEYLKRDVRTFLGSDRLLPGYTVSTVPNDWNFPRDRNSRVIEVADTFIGKAEPQTNNKYGGRVTIEEVLDAIFQETNPSSIPADPSIHNSSPQPPQNLDGPGIYTTNHSLMNRVIEQPYLAEQLLRNEPLIVRCTNCHKTRNISEARVYYVGCKHCYTYYCSKRCRSEDWDRHKDRCSFARINTLCKEVIMKVRKDPETQYHMSKVARDGYRREGRGSVNIRLVSAHSAQEYLEKGWKSLLQSEDPNQLLFYYPIQVLIDQRKEPSLIQLCRKYNPQDKFILSVSIIADIEQCPETPPPEPSSDHRYALINKPIKSSLAQHDRYRALVPTNI